MKIMNQSQINYKSQFTQNFTSNRRVVRDIVNGIPILKCKNNSFFFRDDLDWLKFVEMLKDKYKNTKKVNVYCFACSDGAEPFSLAMLLMEKLKPKEAQKFFPIIASDKDEGIFKYLKQGMIKLDSRDIEDIKVTLGDNYSKYIEVDNKFEYIPEWDSKAALCAGRIKPILMNKVLFRNMDIRRGISDIESNNSVVMCRNFFPYLDDKDQSEFKRALFKHLGSNSIFVRGDFDGNLSDGFRPSEVDNCFIAAGAEEKALLNNPEFLITTFANKK